MCGKKATVENVTEKNFTDCVSVTSNGRVTLRKELCDLAGIRKGDSVQLQILAIQRGA